MGSHGPRMVAAPTPQITAMPARKTSWGGLLASIILGAGILALPTPAGLSSIGKSVVAITVFTVALWVFHVVNNGIASILMMALLLLAGARPAVVFSGFAGGSFWILLCVLFYGFAMQRSGLAQRLSYYILSLFPAGYTGILCAFFVIGLVLALGIPSMTVRTAIMVPIAWALVQSLGLGPRSKGSALIMLTVIEMAVLPGLAFLYGSLFGPAAVAIFQLKNLPLTWLEYAKVMTVPCLFLCASLIGMNRVMLRPESDLRLDSGFVRRELASMGSIKRSEWITAAVVVISIAFWITDRYHHLPSFLIGMFALAVFALSGILEDNDIGAGVSWTLLLFLGGIFGLANVIQEYKAADWLAGYVVPISQHLLFSPLIFLLAIGVAMLLLRFLDPTAFIAIPVLFLPLVDLASATGIRPLVLTAPLLLASAPFWGAYQNFWVAMGEAMTSGEAFSAGQRARLASGYAAMVLVTVVFAVGYWKLAGLL